MFSLLNTHFYLFSDRVNFSYCYPKKVNREEKKKKRHLGCLRSLLKLTFWLYLKFLKIQNIVCTNFNDIHICIRMSNVHAIVYLAKYLYKYIFSYIEKRPIHHGAPVEILLENIFKRFKFSLSRSLLSFYWLSLA